MYLHDWEDTGKDGMLKDFGITEKELDGAEVLLATYTYQDYSGDAFVVFKRDGKLYEVVGSHCSCYGLSEQDYCDDASETQWQPEETSIDALKQRLNKGRLGQDYYGKSIFKNEMRTVLGLA